MSKRTIQRQNDERNRKRRTRHLFVTKVASAVILLLTLVYLLGPFKAAQTSNQRSTSETIRLLTADPRDVFIHGLLQEKHKGTCASLPA